MVDAGATRNLHTPNRQALGYGTPIPTPTQYLLVALRRGATAGALAPNRTAMHVHPGIIFHF